MEFKKEQNDYKYLFFGIFPCKLISPAYTLLSSIFPTLIIQNNVKN